MTPAEIVKLIITILTAILGLLSFLQPFLRVPFIMLFGLSAGAWALARLRCDIPYLLWIRHHLRIYDYRSSTLTLFDVVFAIVVLSVTIGYLGYLGFALWYAYSSVYADLFQKLLDWSPVPVGLWGLYVGYQVGKAAP